MTFISPNIKEKLEVDKKSLEGISADLKEVKSVQIIFRNFFQDISSSGQEIAVDLKFPFLGSSSRVIYISLFYFFFCINTNFRVS